MPSRPDTSTSRRPRHRVLQPAIDRDPSLEWLWEAAGAPAVLGDVQDTQFEVTVPAELLNERPRQTAVDWLVTREQAVLAFEAKFTEQGLGRCSCSGREYGQCSDAVLSRPYWTVVEEELGWTRATEPAPCPVSLAYQAVRNLAAASWQRLLAFAPLPDSVRQWAEEKHGLLAEDESTLPVLCGFDGDGDVWVEVCEAVPTERDALREVAKLDNGAAEWVVVGTETLGFDGAEWSYSGPWDERNFWHVQWKAGPNY